MYNIISVHFISSNKTENKGNQIEARQRIVARHLGYYKSGYELGYGLGFGLGFRLWYRLGYGLGCRLWLICHCKIHGV